MTKRAECKACLGNGTYLGIACGCREHGEHRKEASHLAANACGRKCGFCVQDGNKPE